MNIKRVSRFTGFDLLRVQQFVLSPNVPALVHANDAGVIVYSVGKITRTLEITIRTYVTHTQLTLRPKDGARHIFWIGL